MNYFSYAIKCVIRNIIYKLMKPQNLMILGISAVIIYFMFFTNTASAWEGNNDYTDKNVTIKLQYDSMSNDLITRLSLLQEESQYDTFMTYLSNGAYGYYMYYGSAINGTSMLNRNTYEQDVLYVAFYPLPSTMNVTTYDTWCGMTTDIKKNSSVIKVWAIHSNYFDDYAISEVYMPDCLYNYRPNTVTNYIVNANTEHSSDIVSSINQQTNSINQQTQVIQQQTNTIEQQTQVQQQTQNFITDDTITTENGEMDIDTTGMSLSDNNNVNGFFTSVYNSFLAFFNNISSDVVVIHVPLPHTEQTLDLRSDIISSHIQGTFIYTIIQTLWYFVFGTYFLFYIRFLIRFFSSGEYAEGGLGRFLRHLEDNDVIINSSMM